jgi:uncharacterized membrane protein
MDCRSLVTMDPYLQELLNLAARWVHVIAGIMWVGNSMLFNWLDRNLAKPEESDPHRFGDIWLLHSGGFYHVRKLLLTPQQMPRFLHWFKWQSYITWLSGFILLVLVYYANGGAYMVDPGRSPLTAATAVWVGPGMLLAGWLAYDLLWRSPLGGATAPATLLSLALAVFGAWLFCHLFSGRAAFLHMGALLGTLMAGNVFFHIIPSQKQLVAATEAGELADPRLAVRAKRRSIHNNYITFPVIFLMISNHFAGLYGGERAWLVMLALMAGGAGVRFFMNIRFTFGRAWGPCAFGVAAAALAAVYGLAPRATAPPAPEAATTNGIPFAVANAIVQARCAACHSEHPSMPAFAAATGGVRFDKPEELRAHAERIKFRAVSAKTMPLGNLTSISDEERILLGRWIDEGARTE